MKFSVFLVSEPIPKPIFILNSMNYSGLLSHLILYWSLNMREPKKQILSFGIGSVRITTVYLFCFELLNELCPKRKNGSRGIIIDSTDINLNLNWHAKKITKESLESKEYKWSHSTYRGFFIGMKLNLALESQTLRPLAFLINEANVSESKIYPEILKTQKKKNNKSRRHYLC